MLKIKRSIVATVLLVTLSYPAWCQGENLIPIPGRIHYSIASWYGHGFHGKQTASGQVFNMHALTCAHKSYPFGSWLRITNILNKKSTFCVVNDRGPYETARDLDVSFAAARVLDMISLGICSVRIEYMGMDSSYMKALKYFLHERHHRKSSQRP